MSELRTDRRTQDRKLRDLQHELDEARARVATSTIDGAPALPVVVASPAPTPSGERVVGIADDGSEIVYEGDAALGKKAQLPLIQLAPQHREPVASNDAPTSADRIEVAHHARRSAVRSGPRETPVDRDGDTHGDAGTDYRAAVELVKSGKQEEAVAALHAFLVKYPRHDYADNAQYWLGESFYAQKDYAHALAEFRTVIETYPRGNKVPDALLKVGYCYQALGQTDKAHAVLAQVVNLYPKSEPAVLAAKRLETP